MMKYNSVSMISSDIEEVKVSSLEEKPLKKELRKIDWLVVKRLVVFLYYHNRILRTSIATKCNLGYDKCILYLDWMQKMDLIKKEMSKDEGLELVSLNEKGMEVYTKNFKDDI